MSLSSIDQAANDRELQQRVEASARREAQNNVDLSDSDYGRSILSGVADLRMLYWAVAVDTEAAYEAALVSGRGAPGHDADVITDQQIVAAVQAHWPPDPWPPPPSSGAAAAGLGAQP